MTKDEFLTQFQALNEQIETAISVHNYEHVSSLDATRRQMLHEFATLNLGADDQTFFDALERCAADNAAAIMQMTNDMAHLQRKTGARLRGLTGYRA